MMKGVPVAGVGIDDEAGIRRAWAEVVKREDAVYMPEVGNPKVTEMFKAECCLRYRLSKTNLLVMYDSQALRAQT